MRPRRLLKVAQPNSAHDDGLGQRVGDLAENELALPDADRLLRNLLQHLRALSDRLGGLPAKLERGVAAIRADIDVEAASARLKAIIGGICATIEGARERRLRERPVDAKKIEQLRSAIDQALLTRLRTSIRSFAASSSGMRKHKETAMFPSSELQGQ